MSDLKIESSFVTGLMQGVRKMWNALQNLGKTFAAVRGYTWLVNSITQVS